MDYNDHHSGERSAMYAYVTRTRHGKYRCEILHNHAWLAEQLFDSEKQARSWGKRWIADFEQFGLGQNKRHRTLPLLSDEEAA